MKRQKTSNFILIDKANDRYVIRDLDTLYKLVPVKDITKDGEFKEILKEENKSRFVFWDAIDDKALKEDLICFLNNKNLTPESYNLSMCQYSGIDCLDLFAVDELCKAHCKKPKGQYLISEAHLHTFFNHLATSLDILSNHRILHNDIALRNILVNPTLEEQKTKIITTSLPILIDFGHSQFTKFAETARKQNFHDFISIFGCCVQNACIYGDNKKWWIEQIIDEATLDSTKRLLSSIRKLGSFLRQRTIIEWCNTKNDDFISQLVDFLDNIE